MPAAAPSANAALHAGQAPLATQAVQAVHTPAAGSAGQGHAHDIAVPRKLLIAIGLMLAATIVTIGAMRLAGVRVDQPPTAAVLAERALHFEDRPDGSVAVLDARRPGAAPLAVIDAGSGGFVRGTLRALVRQRRLAGLGAEMPFRLAAHADGRLTLEDPATAQRVDLESFGPTHAASFAALLRPANATTPTPADAARPPAVAAPPDTGPQR